jgi:recombination protein RecR
MTDVTPTMARLMKELQRLPGIGARTAERLAFHLMNAPNDEARALASAITEMRERLTECSICYNRTDADPCAICRDESRDRSVVCVVETPRDVARIEETGLFRGVYHVLKGHLAPAEGIGPDELTIAALLKRVGEGLIKEVILATNPTLQSDATALEVTERLRPLGVHLTRLARGLPSGGTIEYVNRGVLSDALAGRQEIK